MQQITSSPLPADSPNASEPTRLKRSRSDSSVQKGYYQALAGNKRKTSSTEQEGGATALVRSKSAKSVKSTTPGTDKVNPNGRGASAKAAAKREEEEGAAALLGLFTSVQGSGTSNTPGSSAGLLCKLQSGSGLPRSPAQSTAAVAEFSPARPALKRQRSNVSKRSQNKEPELPLLDIKLPEGNGPWSGIFVELRHGKYKGKRAEVLGLAKKKYRVQVEGLEYQLEFYPSYVGLPEPPQDDTPDPVKQTADMQMRRTGTGQSSSIIQANVERSSSELQRTGTGASDGSKSGSKSTSLSSYRSWIGKKVMVKRGKYQGRHAWVLGLASEKLRVVVDQVEHQLEYYPTMFEPPQETDQAIPQPTSSNIEPLTPGQKEAPTGPGTGASRADATVVPSIPPPGVIEAASRLDRVNFNLSRVATGTSVTTDNPNNQDAQEGESGAKPEEFQVVS